MRAVLILGAIVLMAAVRIPAPTQRVETTPTPLPARAYAIAALGRDSAAADAVWLRTIQLIGSNAYSAARYPNLEAWVTTILELDPHFQTPPAVAGVLLVTEPDRADAVDHFLGVAESNAGSSYYFAMLRGFVAYFGRLDVAAAAGHYERAVSRGGPPYLKGLAARLRAQSLQCSDIANDLVEVSVSDHLDQDALKKSAADIVVHCVEADIGRAATTFRISNQRPAKTLDELVEAGLVKLPAPPPGECWTFDGYKGHLSPCGEAP